MVFLTVVPQLTGDTTITGDTIIHGKLDIGKAGVSGGLDVGEGGSYSIGLIAYTYDASAVSGSRFTAVADLNGTNAMSKDAGDRVYYGHANKFWGVRTLASVAKSSSEKYIIKYWNGSILATTSFMGILKDDANSVGENIMLQTTQKEYCTWDIDINNTWIVTDNQTDIIPNTGMAKYWVCFEIPTGGLVQAPTVTEIKIRGSDFDIISGTAFAVYWGLSRISIIERITLDIHPGGGGAIQDQTIASDFKIRVISFDKEGDDVGFMWVLPEGIDTSCGLKFSVDYISEEAQQLTINLKLKKLKTGIAVGSSESADLDEDTTFTVATADSFVSAQKLNLNVFPIQNLNAGDCIAIQVTMKTLPSAGSSNEFIPTSFRVDYVKWTTGLHLGT